VYDFSNLKRILGFQDISIMFELIADSIKTRPKLAMCNFIPEVEKLRDFALSRGFDGIDWTLTVEDLPSSAFEETRLLRQISRLQPLEVRYHCAFANTDLGDADNAKAQASMEVFRQACRLVSRLDGKFITIHVGLGRDSTEGLLWDRTLEALAELVQFADARGIRICLENLAWGWSSRPQLFEKLIRKTSAAVTWDLGHARVCPAVESQQYGVGDFVLPHAERVVNAHIYHEERDDRHRPPQHLADLAERLQLLCALPCDWWVLELRDEPALSATLEVVQRFLNARWGETPRVRPGDGPCLC
jgi:sugar phosphate isomerase/epimerase